MTDQNPSGDKPTSDQKPNDGAGDTAQNKGDADGDSIPKKSYEVIQGKYHSMKEENEKLQKQLADFNKAQKDAEEKKLAEQGKYKELLEQREKEIETLTGRIQAQTANNAIASEATKAGAIDNDAVLALVDKNEIQIVDGKIDSEQVKKAVESLKESKPYLFGEQPKPNIGNKGGAGDGDTNTKRTYKRSELQDSEFFEKNKDDILKAMGEGRIIEG